jgi:hypothetical protein
MSRFNEYLEARKVSKEEKIKMLMSYINIELDFGVLDKELRSNLKTKIEKILNTHL